MRVARLCVVLVLGLAALAQAGPPSGFSSIVSITFPGASDHGGPYDYAWSDEFGEWTYTNLDGADGHLGPDGGYMDWGDDHIGWAGDWVAGSSPSWVTTEEGTGGFAGATGVVSTPEPSGAAFFLASASPFLMRWRRTLALC